MKLTDIIEHEYAIHISKQTDAKKLMKELNKLGLRRIDGLNYSEKYTFWVRYKKNTCYCPSHGDFGHINYYTKFKGCPVIEFHLVEFEEDKII